MYIASIVEGHGEVEAFPPLLHRIAKAEGFLGNLITNPPIRVKSGSFINDDAYRKKNILLASAKAAEHNGLVIILLDCDDGCPASLGPRLLEDAKAVRSDVRILVALAYREYETWFLAAAKSLRGYNGLPKDLEAPANPESIRGGKEWMADKMGTSYDPITHQVAFTRAMNLTEARTNKSFNRLYQKVIGFLIDQG